MCQAPCLALLGGEEFLVAAQVVEVPAGMALVGGVEGVEEGFLVAGFVAAASAPDEIAGAAGWVAAEVAHDLEAADFVAERDLRGGRKRLIS